MIMITRFTPNLGAQLHNRSLKTQSTQSAPRALAVKSLRSEASKGGMKAGRIKDPLYKDYYLGISHLPSPHLLRPPIRMPAFLCFHLGVSVEALGWSKGSSS